MAFLAGGALAGVCVGLLLFPWQLDRGVLPIWTAIGCAGAGTVITFVVGAILWALAGIFPSGITVLRFLTLILIAVEIGAAIGWGHGVERLIGPDQFEPDRPAGMVIGAKFGAVVGFLFALFDAFIRRRRSESLSLLRPSDSAQ